MPRLLRVLGILLLISTAPMVADASQPSRGSGRPAVYKGTWRSNSTGHRGPMRMRLTQRGDGTYQARFMGRFALVIPFTYKTDMSAVSSNSGQTTLVANKRLPIFGNFQTTARVTACGVNADYCAEKDRGRFTMTRVK